MPILGLSPSLTEKQEVEMTATQGKIPMGLRLHLQLEMSKKSSEQLLQPLQHSRVFLLSGGTQAKPVLSLGISIIDWQLRPDPISEIW